MSGDEETRRGRRSTERRRKVWKVVGAVTMALAAFGDSYALLLRNSNPADAFGRVLCYRLIFGRCGSWPGGLVARSVGGMQSATTESLALMLAS